LIVLLAKFLGVSKSAVQITGGATARLKRITVAGEKTALTARLQDLRDVS
jgi:uncharacterized protein YggU (UPF0235/DUF167 family)